MLTLGKQPRASDCLMMEKLAEIIDWLATTAASVEMMNIGQYTGLGTEL